MKNRVGVEILGNKYYLKTENSPEHVHKIAAYLNNKIGQLSKGVSDLSTTDVSILAALNVTDELFRLRENVGKNYQKFYEKTNALVEKIERHID